MAVTSSTDEGRERKLVDMRLCNMSAQSRFWYRSSQLVAVLERYLFGSLGLFFLASICAFLLYVPAMPLLATLAIVVGLIVMFFLGLGLGMRTPRSRRSREELARYKSAPRDLQSHAGSF